MTRLLVKIHKDLLVTVFNISLFLYQVLTFGQKKGPPVRLVIIFDVTFM